MVFKLINRYANIIELDTFLKDNRYEDQPFYDRYDLVSAENLIFKLLSGSLKSSIIKLIINGPTKLNPQALKMFTSLL